MKKILLWLAILALLILMICCIYKGHAEEIQQDITDRTASALTDAGISNIASSVDGRDVTLTANGAVNETQKTSAIDLIKGIWGVRTVDFADDAMASVPAAPAKVVAPVVPATPEVVDLPLPEFNAEYDGKNVVLNGLVGSQEEIDTIISDAKAKFGSEISIVNNLKTGSSEAPTSLFKSGLEQLSHLVLGSLSLNGNELSLKGDAPSPSALQTIKNALATFKLTFPKFKANSNLAVAEAYNNQACQERLNEIVADSNVRFASAKAEIRAESLPLLNRIATASQRCASTISISGHTDSNGDARMNLDLSRSRANAVKEYLASKGVDTSRLIAQGFGERQPKADNATSTGRAINRRIEFNVE